MNQIISCTIQHRSEHKFTVRNRVRCCSTKRQIYLICIDTDTHIRNIRSSEGQKERILHFLFLSQYCNLRKFLFNLSLFYYRLLSCITPPTLDFIYVIHLFFKVKSQIFLPVYSSQGIFKHIQNVIAFALQ